MSQAYELGVVLSLKDMATAKLREVDEKWKTFRSTIEDTHKAVKYFDGSMKAFGNAKYRLGLGVSAIAAAKPAVDSAMQVESALAMLKATSQATTEEMRRYKEAAMQVGAASQFTPQEAVQGLTALASAGLDARQSLNSLQAVLDFSAASAGTVNLDDSAKALASTSLVFKESAGKVADTMVTMANISTFEISELGAAWAGVNQVQAMAHQDINSMAAVMSALKQAGQSAIGAGEKTRMAISSLLTPSRLARQELAQLGVSAYDSSGKFRDVIDIFEDLRKATKHLTENERNLKLERILMTEGMTAYNAVQSAGIDVVKDWTKQFKEGAGAARAFAQTNENTAAGSVKELKAATESLKVTIGDGLVPMFRVLTGAVTAVIRPIVSILQTHPQFVEYGGIVFVVVTAFALLGGVVALTVGAFKWLNAITIMNIANSGIFANVMQALGISTTTATASQWSLNAAMTANPVGVVIVALAALVGLITLAIIYWDEITQAVKNTWAEHKNLITVLSMLIPALGLIVLPVRLLADNWERVTSAVRSAWGWMQRIAGVKESTLSKNKADGLRSETASLKEKLAILETQGLKESDLYKQTASAIADKQAQVKKLDDSMKGLLATERALEITNQKQAQLKELLAESTSAADKNSIKDKLKSLQVEQAEIGMGINNKAMKQATEELKEDAKKSGSATIDAMAEGVKSNAALKNALAQQFASSAALFAHSDADEGPFSRLTASGSAIIGTLADGVRAAGSELKDTLLNTFGDVKLDAVPPPLQTANVHRNSDATVPVFKIDVNNLVGEITMPDRRTHRGGITDIAGLIERAIKQAIDNAGGVTA